MVHSIVVALLTYVEAEMRNSSLNEKYYNALLDLSIALKAFKKFC
jgi:hypothetical protein